MKRVKLTKKNHNSQNRKAKSLQALFILSLLVLGVVTGVVVGAFRSLPAWNPQQLSGAQTTIIYDEEHKEAARLHAQENRIQVPLDKIPQHLIDAVISTEDQEFYRHHGINFKRILGALLVNITRHSKAQGASTLTQQLARVSFLYPEKTYERKIKEILLAFQLEMRYSKDEILEFYLNKVYFGGGAYGVQAAAQTYFGKDVTDLTLAESAMLAGIIQSPNRLSPFRDYDAAKARQKVVLNNMVSCGVVSRREADKAFATPLSFKKTMSSQCRYGYFIDTVVDEADKILTKYGIYENPQYAVYNEGLRIFTTMDAELQAHSEDIYSNNSFFPSGKSRTGQELQSAMVLLDHHTGEVKAIIGGRHYEQQRGFNRATDALRHPGSAFKPVVVYGPALEKGLMPFLVLDDSPVSFSSGGQTWTPRNYDGKYRGLITMRTAVQWSVNVYAVKLAEKIGMKTGIDFAENLGINTLVKAGRHNDMGLSTALGGLTRGVSPLQLAAAYGAFANNGVYVEPHVITKITTSEGQVLYEHRTRYRRVMKPSTAWLMTSMLQTVTEQGTGTRARIPGVPCAGKTGTSQDDQNAWFVGYTPNFTCAVWMGYDKLERMPDVWGGSYPARIWKSMMQEALKGEPRQSFSKPGDIIQVTVCRKSGMLPSELCPDSSIVTEFAVKGSAPTTACSTHIIYNVCPDSGKLAGPYCPFPVPKSFVNVPPGSTDADRPPTEYCNIHSSPGSPVEVQPVCRDPRHRGKLFRANLPQDGQAGGCPSELVEELPVLPDSPLPPCELPDHQLR